MLGAAVDSLQKVAYLYRSLVVAPRVFRKHSLTSSNPQQRGWWSGADGDRVGQSQLMGQALLHHWHRR